MTNKSFTDSSFLADPYNSMMTRLEEGKEIDMISIFKDLEKANIHTLYSSMIISIRDEIIKDSKAKMKTTAEETKTNLTSIVEQMDSAIKGTFSTKVKDTVAEKAKGYDNI